MKAVLYALGSILLALSFGIRAGAASQPPPMNQRACAFTLAAAQDAFSYIDEPASRFDGDAKKLRQIQNASLRSLLVFGICPSVGEEVLAHQSAFTSRWTSMIDSVLKGPEAIYFEQAGTAITCQHSTPLLCKLKRNIEASSQGQKEARHIPANPEPFYPHSFSQRIISDAADEFTEATGEILAATDNLAFALSVFPEQFYAYMEAHPNVLDSWISQASATLFRGDPTSRDDLMEYKSYLVNRVEHYKPMESQLTSTKNKVLTMLKSAPVSVID